MKLRLQEVHIMAPMLKPNPSFEKVELVMKSFGQGSVENALKLVRGGTYYLDSFSPEDKPMITRYTTTELLDEISRRTAHYA